MIEKDPMEIIKQIEFFCDNLKLSLYSVKNEIEDAEKYSYHDYFRVGYWNGVYDEAKTNISVLQMILDKRSSLFKGDDN